MTAATERSANVRQCARLKIARGCVGRVCSSVSFMQVPRACAHTFPVAGDPSSGSYYKAVGMHGRFRLTDEKKT